MAKRTKRVVNRKQDGEPTQFGGYVGYFPSQYLPVDTHLTADQAMTLSAVWGCVSFISNAIATSEIKVLDVAVDGRRVDSSSDRVYRLLNLRPNPDVSAVTLKSAWISQALIYGDGFIQIRRDMAGRPFELYLLPSTGVIPKREGERIVYEYTPTTAGIGKQLIPSDDVIHLPGQSLNSFLGESVVSKAARSIAIAKAADEFALSYYANNTVLGGTLTRTGPMDANALKALQENFEQARKGAMKAHKAIVLPTGVSYTPIETDASKSQSVESRQHSVVDICRFFGVPPPLVGDLGRATWANLESLYIQVVRDCLGVWAKRIQEEVEWKCFGESSTKWIEVDLKPLTRGDAKSRAEANQVLRRNGVINANEWREDEGLDPIGEEGDLYVIEANMTLLDEEALTPPEPSSPAAPSGTPDPTQETDTEDPETEDPAAPEAP
jgi:HK97 family phage portal protein